MICKNCGKEFEYSKMHKVYCSTKCRRQFAILRKSFQQHERVRERIENNIKILNKRPHKYRFGKLSHMKKVIK